MPREVVPDRDPVSFVEEFGADTGRVRHDAKITVYLSADELAAIEQTRTSMRDDHAIRVDRGRIVRAAVAAMIEDYHAAGTESQLWQRLQG